MNADEKKKIVRNCGGWDRTDEQIRENHEQGTISSVTGQSSLTLERMVEEIEAQSNTYINKYI